MSNPPVVLCVAGTDSGGAAGLAADLATVAALGAHGACVVTAVTAQDTTGVHAVHPVPAGVVAAQLAAVLEDLPVSAVKTGMLGSAEVVDLLARRLAGGPPVVVDPVLVATSGAVLGDEEVVAAYRELLLPACAVVTPNPAEARALLGQELPAQQAAAALAELGCAAVVTGGPDLDRPEQAVDWVALPGAAPVPVAHAVVDTENDHGTGCTHSAALATAIARGRDVPDAARSAAAYTTRQLRESARWTLGRGRGPIAHTSHTAADTAHHPTPDPEAHA